MISNYKPTEKDLREQYNLFIQQALFLIARDIFVDIMKMPRNYFMKILRKERDLFSVMLFVIKSNKFLTELRKFK